MDLLFTVAAVVVFATLNRLVWLWALLAALSILLTAVRAEVVRGRTTFPKAIRNVMALTVAYALMALFLIRTSPKDAVPIAVYLGLRAAAEVLSEFARLGLLPLLVWQALLRAAGTVTLMVSTAPVLLAVIIVAFFGSGAWKFIGTMDPGRFALLSAIVALISVAILPLRLRPRVQSLARGSSHEGNRTSFSDITTALLVRRVSNVDWEEHLTKSARSDVRRTVFLLALTRLLFGISGLVLILACVEFVAMNSGLVQAVVNQPPHVIARAGDFVLTLQGLQVAVILGLISLLQFVGSALREPAVLDDLTGEAEHLLRGAVSRWHVYRAVIKDHKAGRPLDTLVLPGTQPSEDFSTLVRRGDDAYGRGNWQAAEDAFRDALAAAGPDDRVAYAWTMLGDLYNGAGFTISAAQAYLNAAETGDQSVREYSRVLWAGMCLQNGEMDDVVRTTLEQASQSEDADIRERASGMLKFYAFLKAGRKPPGWPELTAAPNVAMSDRLREQ